MVLTSLALGLKSHEEETKVDSFSLNDIVSVSRLYLRSQADVVEVCNAHLCIT